MTSPFGGGCEDMCGTLSGEVMGIGVTIGRSDAKGDTFASYDAAKKLHEQFQRNFGSTLCRELNHGDFRSREHAVRCKDFTWETVNLTYRILKKA